jgi:hypothetical protein
MVGPGSGLKAIGITSERSERLRIDDYSRDFQPRLSVPTAVLPRRLTLKKRRSS